MRLFFILLILSHPLYGKHRYGFPIAEIVLEPKSHRKAFALSLFLPGLGEHYMGDKSGALRGYITETAIWGTFFGLRWYAGVLAKDAILFAHENAGAKMGQDESYYEAVEWYRDLEAYNIAVRNNARFLYPESKYKDARERQLKYIEENSIPESLKWEWKNEDEWERYRKIRSSKRGLLHKAGYCIGGAILNRIFSAIITTHLPVGGIGLFIYPEGVRLSILLN